MLKEEIGFVSSRSILHSAFNVLTSDRIGFVQSLRRFPVVSLSNRSLASSLHTCHSGKWLSQIEMFIFLGKVGFVFAN